MVVTAVLGLGMPAAHAASSDVDRARTRANAAAAALAKAETRLSLVERDLTTLEDVLEALVGDIRDEHDSRLS